MFFRVLLRSPENLNCGEFSSPTKVRPSERVALLAEPQLMKYGSWAAESEEQRKKEKKNRGELSKSMATMRQTDRQTDRAREGGFVAGKYFWGRIRSIHENGFGAQETWR